MDPGMSRTSPLVMVKLVMVIPICHRCTISKGRCRVFKMLCHSRLFLPCLLSLYSMRSMGSTHSAGSMHSMSTSQVRCTHVSPMAVQQQAQRLQMYHPCCHSCKLISVGQTQLHQIALVA